MPITSVHCGTHHHSSSMLDCLNIMNSCCYFLGYMGILSSSYILEYAYSALAQTSLGPALAWLRMAWILVVLLYIDNFFYFFFIMCGYPQAQAPEQTHWAQLEE